MSNRRTIALGIGGFALLVLAALWILLQPPRGSAGVGRLKAGVPALGLRYSYNPEVFQPAPYDAKAEFPLRADASDWSLYAKRVRGAGQLLQREAQPAIYGFIAEVSSAEYEDFFRLEEAVNAHYDEVVLAGQQVLRQKLVLRRGARSLGWPAHFPYSVTAGQTGSLLPPREDAEEIFSLPEELRPPAEADAATPADTAWVYSWALFEGEDLFIFQAIGPRELNTAELGLAEALIEDIEYNALQGEG